MRNIFKILASLLLSGIFVLTFSVKTVAAACLYDISRSDGHLDFNIIPQDNNSGITQLDVAFWDDIVPTKLYSPAINIPWQDFVPPSQPTTTNTAWTWIRLNVGGSFSNEARWGYSDPNGYPLKAPSGIYGIDYTGVFPYPGNRFSVFVWYKDLNVDQCNNWGTQIGDNPIDPTYDPYPGATPTPTPTETPTPTPVPTCSYRVEQNLDFSNNKVDKIIMSNERPDSVGITIEQLKPSGFVPIPSGYLNWSTSSPPMGQGDILYYDWYHWAGWGYNAGNYAINDSYNLVYSADNWVTNWYIISGPNPTNQTQCTLTGISSPTPTPTPTPIPQLTSLAPAKVWVGLKNSDDVGIKFDLLAEAYANGNLVSSGELDSVAGGSSGFNNAHLQTIAFTSFSPVDFPQGSILGIRVYVRNACSGSGHNSGTARLWYNDPVANSQFGATIGTNTNPYYLLTGFLLGTAPGSGPKQTIDVAAGSKCSAFKPFGTWMITP